MTVQYGERGEPVPLVKRGRGRPRDPRADERIIAAAAELLTERGFDGMTVDDVADRAGVGKATVYRRWPSKNDLAVAAMSKILQTEFPEPDTGSVVSDLRELVASGIAFASSPAGATFMRMCIAESIRDPRIAALYRESTERKEAQSLTALQKGIARGEVRADARLEYALSWIAGIMTSRVIADRPMPTQDEVDDIVRFLLRGVLEDPGSV